MSNPPQNSKPRAALQARLLDEVVIFENQEAKSTGAQSIAPDHAPRQPHQERPLPPQSALFRGAQTASLQQRVEQLLFHQSELLDGKHWGAYIDLFEDDGIYWMPVTPEQTEWLDSPSIFAEDRRMMQIRMGRVTHPNAWSQAPNWGTSHVVGNVVIEAASDGEIQVRSRFHMVELRRDNLRHFAGTYRHTLKVHGDALKIALQRVDLLNAQAPFDYVLQIWV
ncbi:MAG TPA: aromatic-ring-hydroxylating dioxygenase subunit beta [Steroidobacteraceae bacterium]|jgi:3-phenylpropionate/cinnamic acid dioxygenase small subunit|nr:aromatic-ring-hydroxylating dioxygenase subunit beta [Steroidobacteraceae bacterium]